MADFEDTGRRNQAVERLGLDLYRGLSTRHLPRASKSETPSLENPEWVVARAYWLPETLSVTRII